MNDKDILLLLKEIINLIKNTNIKWRIEGSANLRIQGINTKVNDLDIITDKNGFEVFKKVLKNTKYTYIEKYKEVIDANILLFYINGFEVEVLTRKSNLAQRLDMFDKVKIIEWHNLSIPILPLLEAKYFYELIDRKDKVELINEYLK